MGAGVTFPLRDFAAVFADFIAADGAMNPPVAFCPITGQVWLHPDKDGVIVTMTVHSLSEDEEPCLLTALFPMSPSQIRKTCRDKRSPVLPGDLVCVKRRVDEVTGRSGETYSRFEVDVTRVASRS